MENKHRIQGNETFNEGNLIQFVMLVVYLNGNGLCDIAWVESGIIRGWLRGFLT